MDKKIFDELRKIIHSKCGIALSDNKISLVSSRINKRLRVLGLSEYKEYVEYLKNEVDGEEMVQFLDVVSTNVTYFFREAAHFDLLVDIIKKDYNAGQRKFRLWCAASSSGEEPYTMTMMILDALSNPRDLDLKILATDISTKVLNIANKGEYSEHAVRDIPKKLLNTYFTKIKIPDGIKYKVTPQLRNVITFKRLNLSVHPFPMKGPMDLIFCRNVMIYFDKPVRKELVEDFYRLLKKSGHLMLGHSESLTGLGVNFKSIKPAAYIKQ